MHHRFVQSDFAAARYGRLVSSTSEATGATEVVIERSPADVLRLAVAAALIVALVLLDIVAGNSIRVFAAELVEGVDAFPSWLLDGVVAAARLGVLGAVVGALVLGLATVNTREIRL